MTLRAELHRSADKVFGSTVTGMFGIRSQRLPRRATSASMSICSSNGSDTRSIPVAVRLST